MTIAEAYRRYHSINIEMLINDAFDSASEQIEQLNREQLEKGITSTGEKLGDKAPFYYPGYFDGHKQHRQLLGLQVGHVDLKMTGKFYESLFVELDGVKYSIMSNDDPAKVEALMYGGGKSGGQSLCGCQSVREGGFGEEIFGLTDENKLTVKGLTRDILIEIIEQVMNI